MAILKQRLNRKNSSGSYDTIYLETIATVVKMSDTDSTLLSTKISSMDTTIAGKAAASHNHSAANITSGTLAVARGGTGQTSVDTTPTSGSKKMCTSGGIYTALSGKQAAGSYAAANHNHNGVYQPAGSYAKPTDIPAALRGEYGIPLEMGKYIDFHTINSTADYDARLTCTNSWLSVNEHRIVAVASWDGTNLYLT